MSEFEKQTYLRVKAVAMWARTQTPDKDYDKFNCCYTQLSDSAVAALKAEGIEVRNKEEFGNFIKLSGTKKPVVEFEDGTPCSDELGNGTEVILRCFASTYNQKPGVVKGKVAKIIVLNLVPFGGPAGEEGEEVL